MKNIEDKIEELEGYFKEEMIKIKELIVKEKPKDLFSITTYEEVIKELKEFAEISPYKKIKQIEKLFNGDWKKDLLNNKQEKWYPYFTINSYTGFFMFHGSHYHMGTSYSVVAFYKDKKTSDHVGKNFFNIYKEL